MCPLKFGRRWPSLGHQPQKLSARIRPSSVQPVQKVTRHPVHQAETLTGSSAGAGAFAMVLGMSPADSARPAMGGRRQLDRHQTPGVGAERPVPERRLPEMSASAVELVSWAGSGSRLAPTRCSR